LIDSLKLTIPLMTLGLGSVCEVNHRLTHEEL
jgi:hypothetical protein